MAYIAVLSKIEFRKRRMIVSTAADRPVELAITLGDRLPVDACDATLHQPVHVELPVLVTVGAKPIAAVVVKLIGKAYSDALSPYLPADTRDISCLAFSKFRRRLVYHWPFDWHGGECESRKPL